MQTKIQLLSRNLDGCGNPYEQGELQIWRVLENSRKIHLEAFQEAR